MALPRSHFQVAHPAHENSFAIGVVGTAYMAVGGVTVLGLYVLDPDDPSDLEIVEHLLFAEAELEELAA